MAARSRTRDGWGNRIESGVLTRGAGVWRRVQARPRLERRVNTFLIGRAAGKMPARPDPFSTRSDYTSWRSLTDLRWDGRHLGPSELSHPPLDDVTGLFRRSGDEERCEKSTVLFAYFAMWATDGFLRSERPRPRRDGGEPRPGRPGRNEATHEIDLCQIYGVRPATTEQLREHVGGRLLSQCLNGQEYPPFLYDERHQSRFSRVRVAREEQTPAGRWKDLFAIGSDTGNVQVGHVMLNVLFLREHNRIARALEERHPRWDDERLFQTARVILIALHLKLVIEEYINHITPYHFKFRLPPPGAFAKAPWFRPNRMALEFDLLYRWHSLIPSQLTVGRRRLDVEETTFNPRLVVERGLGAMFQDASRDSAGRVGLFNTHPMLLPAERATVEKARVLRVTSYNDYRAHCDFPRVTRFDQISGSEQVQEALHARYRTVDRIEFYPGLFAEDVRPGSVLPGLMGRMVGVDAFSQALTNPLLAPRVFTERTFTRYGMQLITDTSCLGDVLQRNVPPSDPAWDVRMTRSEWRP